MTELTRVIRTDSLQCRTLTLVFLVARVGNALLLVSLIVGGIMGALAIVFTRTTPWFDSAGGNDVGVAFAFGFVVGLAVCSILLSTVASGVNTVIVMFADAPADLQQNHPDISQKMRRIWGEIYPGSV